MNPSRPRLILETAVTALLVIAFYHPLLRLNAIQSGGDFANLFWPIKIFIQESIQLHGVIPLWNFFSFLGVPLHASLQHAIFYPPERVVYTLFPAHAAMNIMNLFHLVLAGTGMWAWLRIGLRLPGVASVVCGALFPCTAWFWGQQEHINQLAAISWMPMAVLLWWLFLANRLGALPFIVAYSMLSTWQFLTGHPQEAVYSQLLCAALLLGFLAISKDRLAMMRRLLPVCLSLGVLAGLMVALQLLPTLELSSHSRRQFPDPMYALSFSMPPDLFLTYLSPHYFGSFLDGYFVRAPDGAILPDIHGNPIWDRRAYGEYGLFIGLPALLLAVVGIFTARRRLAIWLAILIVTSWLLAMGGNTDPARILAREFTEFPTPGMSIHELFLTLFPPAKGFRVPARIVILATFALVTLAAFGYTFLSMRLSDRSRIPIVGAIALLLFAAVYLPSRREKYHYPVDIRPAVELLGAHSSPIDALDRRVFRMTLADDGRLIAERHHETSVGAGDPIHQRMLALQPHMNVIWGVAIVDGYEEGLAPTARYKDFLYEFNRNMRQFRPDAEFLALLGVEFVYTDLPIDESSYPPGGARRHTVPLFYNPKARGAAFWMEATDGADLSRFDGPFWRGGTPHHGWQSQAVDFGRLQNWDVLERLPRLETRMKGPNKVEVLFYTSSVPHPGDALLAMAWYPGWEANGHPVEFLSAVHAHLPAAHSRDLGSGAHGWLLEYRPFSWRAGLYLSAIGLLFWSVGTGILLSRRRDLRA